MIITSTESLPGKEISEILGLVRGNTIRARHLGSDIGASLKSLVGGEIKGYVKVMTDSREKAVERMLDEARVLGADAIVATRFTTSQVMDGAAEIMVYGTAVTLK
ncbi:MAG: heavy metal-binding domain-containing protein [Candidatus Paceibacterota bacterium]